MKVMYVARSPQRKGGALSPELRELKGYLQQGYQWVHNGGETVRMDHMSSTAYFASGCFWGAERRFWGMDGVISTSVGYMGGTCPNPTYEELCTGLTAHAEMVAITFDESKVSYQRLLEEFWTMHDPTSLNQQGGDIGTQYRSLIYTTTPAQYMTAIASRSVYQGVLTAEGLGQIATEIISAKGVEYYLAEDYHQKYLAKNPNGYDCHSSTGVAYPTVGA